MGFFACFRLSVLHHAALVGDNTLIKLLLANGISIDAKDNKGMNTFIGMEICYEISIDWN